MLPPVSMLCTKIGCEQRHAPACSTVGQDKKGYREVYVKDLMLDVGILTVREFMERGDFKWKMDRG